jgi:hypothetical protein
MRKQNQPGCRCCGGGTDSCQSCTNVPTTLYVHEVDPVFGTLGVDTITWQPTPYGVQNYTGTGGSWTTKANCWYGDWARIGGNYHWIFQCFPAGVNEQYQLKNGTPSTATSLAFVGASVTLALSSCSPFAYSHTDNVSGKVFYVLTYP